MGKVWKSHARVLFDAPDGTVLEERGDPGFRFALACRYGGEQRWFVYARYSQRKYAEQGLTRYKQRPGVQDLQILQARAEGREVQS